MKNYVTEFIGTFFLVLTVCLAASLGGAMAGLAIGASLMIMVYMGGHISGAHYNPAVTLAVLMRGKIDTTNAVIYMVVQIAAGLVATLIANGLLLQSAFTGPAVGEGYSVGGALVNEILYTFALALVVLNVATSKATAGNSYYGLAIGFTVVVGAIAGGAISGGAYNPAVGLGTLLGASVTAGASIGHVWIYLVGPFLGGALAALVYRVQNPEEYA